MTGECVKAFVRECYHLSYQFVNLWCEMLVDVVTTPNPKDSHRTRFIDVTPPAKSVLFYIYYLYLGKVR